jgi:SAM-dependent methyltransferase
VLETHCGDARAAAGLLPSPAVASYTAADFSEGMLSVAASNLGGHATTVVADATKLPFPDGSFDRYASNLGLCCTPDLTAKLTEARRILGPGGVAAMSMRIEGGDGDTAFKLVSDALASFGMPPGPTREGVVIGKNLPALRDRLVSAGFAGGAVAWRTFATLPIHDSATFMEMAKSQPPTRKFLEGLEASGQRQAAEQALAQAATEALSNGAIQLAVAVVIARC